MKLNKELEVLLNNQINMELAAAYQYQAMAAYFDERALEGFANWMGNQAKEEIEHSKKFYEYVLKRNGKIEFLGLDKPKMDFTSVKEVFEAALAHEESVTAAIENIHKLARELGDYGAEVFLNEFAEEQEEEEEQAQKIIDKIVSLDVDNNSATLYLLDKEMGTRE